MSKNHVNQQASDLPSLKSLYNRSSLTAILLSVLMVGVVMASLGVSKLLTMAQMNLTLVARSASVAIEVAVYFDDREIIQEQLAQLLPGADVQKALLVYPDHSEYEAWHIEEGNQLTRVKQQLLQRFLKPVSANVSFQNEQLATLKLWHNGEQILRFLMTGSMALIVSLLTTALVILLVTRRLHELLSRPLLELASVTARVRTERDFSLRVSRSKIAEIDSLRVDFNALLDELGQWQGTMESINQHLQYHANHDALTGLANRFFFEKTFQRGIEHAEKNQYELAILYLDGNDFKLINDTYGHATGDEVLKVMSQRIKSAIRETDLVARVGGDEFCVLLNHLSDTDEVLALQREIAMAVNGPMTLSSQEVIDISMSIGSARYPKDGKTLDALLHAADYAMYQAKQHEKNHKKHYHAD